MATTTGTERPRTYFLQEAAERGMRAIAHRLDHEEGGRPYFLLRLQPVPQLEHHIWDWGDMCSRFTDAYLLGRQMTGASAYRDEERILRGLLDGCAPFLNPFMAGRMLLAYVDLYLANPSEENRRRIDDLARDVRGKLVLEADIAYWFRHHEGWNTKDHAVFGDFNGYPTFPLGGIMLALARYTESAEAPESEELLDRMCRFVLEASGTFDEEGRYYGHTHSGGILTAAVAIMRRAVSTGNAETMRRMKNAFDWTLRYSGSWGWVPDGLGPDDASCESCSITDAIHLGLLVARHMDAGYYAIVERFARNQLLENQFVHPERMLPEGPLADRERIEDALRGSWASWSLPGSLDNCTESVEGCCLGAGVRACFLVWDDIVTKRGDGPVRVNMLLSRNSEWVEIVSYLPYEGRLELHVHEAPDLQVRIPEWVSGDGLQVTVGGQPMPFERLGDGYIRLVGAKPGEVVSIVYPLPTGERTERVSGNDYKVRWRGDTVVSVTPSGRLYPLYERGDLERDTAPMASGRPYEGQKGGPVHW